jgi:hypothetical protein
MLYYHDFENSGICGFTKSTLWNTGKKLFKNPHELQTYMRVMVRLKDSMIYAGADQVAMFVGYNFK